jgi:hypothetical protein
MNALRIPNGSGYPFFADLENPLAERTLGIRFSGTNIVLVWDNEVRSSLSFERASPGVG